VSPGQRFEKGAELYRFANLNCVWVMADIPEKDRDLMQSSSHASIRYQGHAFPARMSPALPQFDETTRTLKTRFELDNPGLILRPSMFVEMALEVTLTPCIHIPVDALMDTGARKTVYVDRGNGFFEPRQVEIGWRLGDRVQIIRGLEAGERIAISGNFLLDSESRLRSIGAPSVQGSRANAEADPVCKMSVDPTAAATLEASYDGRTYHFCSDRCRDSFRRNPRQYLTSPAERTAQAPL
jgi:Cu(I)/Ag(I) efflux system membrane fusion protein